jgi:hypothetical protein
MKKVLITLLMGMSGACSPIPELAGIIPVVNLDAGVGDFSMGPGGGPRRGDLGGDLGSTPGMAPCPMIFGMANSFCYWPTGAGSLNLGTALALTGMPANCTLATGKLTATAALATCAVAFDPTVVAAWGFLPAKAVHMAFSYTTKSSLDRAILTVTMPAGNEVIKVDGIAGGPNVLNLYVPAGAMFAPGFSLTLAGALKNATLTFDWISVWQ